MWPLTMSALKASAAFSRWDYARFFHLMERPTTGAYSQVLFKCLLFLLAPTIRQRALQVLNRALHKNERLPLVSSIIWTGGQLFLIRGFVCSLTGRTDPSFVLTGRGTCRCTLLPVFHHTPSTTKREPFITGLQQLLCTIPFGGLAATRSEIT